MAGRPRKHPKVHIKWSPERTEGERTYAILRWTQPGTGKRPSEPIGYVTPEEAETARERKQAALLLGVQLVDGSPKPWSVAAVIDEYLDDLEERLGEESPYLRNETKRLAYVSDLLGRVAVSALTTKRLQTYAHTRAKEVTRNGATVRRSSIKEEILAFRRAWRCVRELGHPLGEVPSFPSLAALPDDARPERRLTEADVAALIEAAGVEGGRAPGVQSLVAVLAWSGRRPIAVFALRRRDCARLLDEDLPRDQRLVWWERDKGGRGRGWGPVTEPAYLALRERLTETDGQPDDALLWPTASGLEWDAVKFSRTFDRIEEIAELDNVQPYDLRKFGCTKILAGVNNNAKAAIRFTGHRTVQTLLQRYVFAEVGAAEEAATAIGWSSPSTEPGELRVVPGGRQR